MKYAFFMCALILFNNPSAKARAAITSFNDSPALMTIAQFMMDNAEDMPVSSRISDKKLKVMSGTVCEVVNAHTVVSEVESAINKMLRVYPDEELPVEEALSDLEIYVGQNSLKKCKVTQTNDHKKINVSYFYDSKDVIHIKIDTVTLLSL